MIRLKHVLDLDRNFDRLPWAFRVLSPDESAIGFATGPKTLSLFKISPAFAKVRDFPIPEGALRVAPHPRLDRIAVHSDASLSVLDSSGAVLMEAKLDPTWGKPAALAFDRSGTRICLTRGFDPSDDCANRLLVLDAQSLSLRCQTLLEGESDAGHFLTWHPKEEVLAIDVACGQDGTWLNLIRISGSTCERLPQEPEASEPYGMLSFADEGRALPGAGESWIRRWGFPDCDLMAELALPEGHHSSYVAAACQGSVLAPIEQEEGSPYLLVLDGSTLKERFRLDLESTALSSFVYPHGIVVCNTPDSARVFQVENA